MEIDPEEQGISATIQSLQMSVDERQLVNRPPSGYSLVLLLGA
jgi:hypothetical protein